MAGKTILEIPLEKQAGMLRELRRGRYGYLLALHVLLLCAAVCRPTLISAVMFCSRTSVYRIVAAYQSGEIGIEFSEEGIPRSPIRTTVLMPFVKVTLLGLLKKSPQALGWCRTRWSCALLAMELKARRGIEVSAETMRRWLGEIG